ncbi:MAG TPA: NAD-dependent epimerase/dehydratase family protein [Candidatus Saccharimonadales bacterium]|nr:NAD-dependent epimerase/dehydratase family protein [Candidatus Saccharimonadales bacterium]
MSSKNNSFWKNKRVFITGIHGFIGAKLADELEKRGAVVCGISRSQENKHIIKANIIDYSRVDEIIREKKIDIAFHLAAESVVESGQVDPYQTFKINTLGTLNILESARKNNLEKIIIASTSHVYGDSPLPFKEEYFPRPTRPYETSKTCIDLIAQSYADTFSLPVLISRFSNIYGPGDTNFDRLIPKTIKSVLANNAPSMWGNGSIREYMYIDDAVEGYIKLGEVPIETVGRNRIFNFGVGKRVSVQQVMKKIIKLSGKTLQIQKIEGGRAMEIEVQYVSSAKAKRLLHWSAKISLEDGLEKTIDWYKKYFKTG